jgi:hypothetical protein
LDVFRNFLSLKLQGDQKTDELRIIGRRVRKKKVTWSGNITLKDNQIHGRLPNTIKRKKSERKRRKPELRQSMSYEKPWEFNELIRLLCKEGRATMNHGERSQTQMLRKGERGAIVIKIGRHFSKNYGKEW